MPLYSGRHLALMRQDMAKFGTVDYLKDDINLAVQAVDDLMVGAGKTAIFNTIETAAPGKFNNARKVQIFLVWVKRRFGQDRGN